MSTAIKLIGKWSWFLKLLVGLAAVFLLLQLDENPGDFATLFTDIDPLKCTWGCLIFVGSISLTSLRWHQISQAMGFSISLSKIVSYDYIGEFFSFFLPTAVGGDVTRIFNLGKSENQSMRRATCSVAADRIVGLSTTMIMAGSALIFMPHFALRSSLATCIATIFGGLAFGLLLVLKPGLLQPFAWLLEWPLLKKCAGANLCETYQHVLRFVQNPRAMMVAIGLSFLVQAVEIMATYLLALSLGIDLPVTVYFAFLPLIWLVTMLPVSFNGLGVREGAFVFFFGLVGLASTQGILLSLLIYFCRVLAGLVGALFLMLEGISLKQIASSRVAAGKIPESV